MNIVLFSQLKQRKIYNPIKDITSGIVIALVSIPIAMGYAQIAGLPAIYGLYGSFLPILIYAFMTTSPQFAIGVDAMPAAMVGTLITSLALDPGSDKVMSLVPTISFLVGIWFIIFYFVKAGRVVKYISVPVMSGFISGVGFTIILMQIPKLFGGNPGTGVLLALLINIASEFEHFNLLSAVLGIGTIVIILICKKYLPKIPMTVFMMVVGAILQIVIKLDRFGVKLLPAVSSGLPQLLIPNLRCISGNLVTIIFESFSIAAVIMAQTLLATNNYASKYGDNVDNGKELLSYAGMNFASALVGCCPINGSVSRSGMADSLGVRSQLMSISAGITMILILLFGTPVLQFLPVPVLTGIVMTALIGILDFKMFSRLWQTCKSEWVIFMLSFAGVLALGTVNGVIVGCALSFWEVSVRAASPPTCFVGRIPGRGNFHSLNRNTHAHPIKNTVIYRFSGNLFFANIDKFENDIMSAIKEDTHQVVVDARGIGSIDVTAVDRLISFAEQMNRKGIKFYVTEHESSLNDQIRAYGGEKLLDSGVVRRTITLALRDAGLEKPYKLEDIDLNNEISYMESEEKLAEFEWAFGEDAEDRLKRLANDAADELVEQIAKHEEHISVFENHGATTKWGMLGLFDEHEFWDFLEARFDDMAQDGVISEEDAEWINDRIEARRLKGEQRLSELNPRAIRLLSKHREKILEYLKNRDPESYEHMSKIIKHIHENDSANNVSEDE